MAGKVGQESKVTPKPVKTPVKEIKPRPATNQELAAQIAGEAVKQTMKEFMPVFEKLLEKNQAPVTVQLEDNLSSIQSRVVRDIQKQLDRRITENKRFMQSLVNAPASDYITMRIPRVFAKYFGSQMLVGLNGSVIQVPVNGRPFRVHKHYVPIINQKIEYEDQKIAYMEQTNFEDIAEVPDAQSIGRI